MPTKIQSLFYTLFLLTCANFHGQTVRNSFTLVCGKKSVKVNSRDVLTLHLNDILNDGNIINRKATGPMNYIDTINIALDTVSYKDKFVGKPFKNRKYWALENNVFKTVSFNVSDINVVSTHREGFLVAMRVTLVSSLVTALIVSPLASLENGKVNFEKVKIISGVSIATCGLSLLLSKTFGAKNHRLIPAGNKNKIWTIQK